MQRDHLDVSPCRPRRHGIAPAFTRDCRCGPGWRWARQLWEQFFVRDVPACSKPL